nr:PREDICTED: aminopeptidase N-like [Linepithema humile]
MTVIKCLLGVTLLFVTSQSVHHEDNEVVEEYQENPYRLPKHVVPTHYNIKLIPHIVEGNFTFNGETSIDIEVHKMTNSIALHTVLLTIDESLTRLTGGNGNAVDNYIPRQHDYNNETNILTIQFEELLYPGTYTLYLKYVGVLIDYNGFYKSFYMINNDRNIVWVAATHFQPVTARQAFPCWDEPAIKATFKFSIKHYPNYVALSNMPSTRSNVDEADGKVWTYFETTPIMSTNILGFVIANYDYISNLDGTIKIWGPKHLLQHAAYPLDIAEKATQELEKFTNSTTRMPKMDHIAIPVYTSRATENWGMITYLDRVLLQDYNSSSIENKVYNTMTITHEIAHQWFGNLVSPAWWDYLWLSEGMATYLKFYITDKFLKEWRLMDWYVLHDILFLLRIDSNHFNKPININITSHSDVRKAYSPTHTYTKPSILLRMLSHFLREDVFQNGLIKYLQAHEYSSVTPDNLWKALQDALDESDVPHDDFNVKEVMDTWFSQAGYPIVTINRDYTTGEIKVTQEKFLVPTPNNTESNSTWWIPINFATQSNLNFSSTLASHWLKPKIESIMIEAVDINDWIIVNKHLTGFYRVNYDITNWKRIAIFLNSDDYVKIPVLNRLQIIDDAYYMIKTERLDPVTFLEIINYTWRETDPVIWKRLFEIISTLNDFLLQPEATVIFKPYLFNLMNKLLEYVSFDEQPNDDPLTIQVRNTFYRYTCVHGHPKCQTKATTKLLAYVNNPTVNTIPFNQEIIFCIALTKANESIWNQFLQASKETSSDHSYLGCSENIDINKKHLNSIIMKNVPSMRNIYYMLFDNMLVNLQNLDATIDYFINNFDEITVGTNGDNYILSRIISASVTEEQVKKIKALIESHNIDEYVSSDLIKKRKRISKVRENMSKILSAIGNNELSVTLYNTLNNSALQPNITNV